MKWFKRNGLTKATGLLVLAAIMFTQFSQKRWNDEVDIINSDVRSYYAYLPALFIHQDLKLEDKSVYTDAHAHSMWHSEDKDGTRYIKYTCGMAMLYSPFFGVAHLLAEPLGAPADGFSYPYRFALAMSSIVYFIIGFIFLSKLLLRYFNDRVVSITLLILFAGTNAFHYYTGNMAYSHGYSLALVAVFLYCSVQWINQPKLKWAIWIGITAGLFTLIRPVDVLFILALPLFGISSFQSLKNRFVLFWKKRWHVLLMLVFFFLMLTPQFMYFKYIWGSYIHYSYTGEAFYFGSPHLLDSLFSYRNGWLLYSPLMLFSVIGLIFLRRQKEHFAAFVIPVGLIYFYVISSWWCWWYVGFGNRAFINLYPILAIPLACAVHYLLSRKAFLKIAFSIIVFVGILFSMFNTRQFVTGAIHYTAMSEAAYWDSFLREKPSQLFQSLLNFPVGDEQAMGRDVILEPIRTSVYRSYYHFEDLQSCDSTMRPFVQFDLSRNGKGAIRVEEGTEFMGKMPVNVKDVSAIYATAWIKDLPEDVFLTLSKTEPVFYYHAASEAVEQSGAWSKVHMLAWVPVGFQSDSMEFVIWNLGKHGFIMDDLTIEGVHFAYEWKER